MGGFRIDPEGDFLIAEGSLGVSEALFKDQYVEVAFEHNLIELSVILTITEDEVGSPFIELNLPLDRSFAFEADKGLKIFHEGWMVGFGEDFYRDSKNR